MSVLLQVNDLSKHYGAAMIFEGATASFSKGQKIGVIGRNGAGKTTLCRILTGEEEPEAGTVTRSSALRLSYLQQQDPFSLDETVGSFLSRFTGRALWECAEIAGKFQLKNGLLEEKIGRLSAGYRTRVKLAAMLLEDPNFLVLDEPTNFLDLATLILLENFLAQFRGGFLIVSHDREFLKRTCTHTLEIENGRMAFYPGDVETYFDFKEQQQKQIEAYNRSVEKKKEQLQEFVDRFRAKAATATRAKAKLKQMGRLKTIEIQHAGAQVKIVIPSADDQNGVALRCEGLSVGYPEKTVAEAIRLEVDRGQHVAVLGDNGQGKTTFLRTLAGNLSARQGEYRWGTGLKIGYYAQHVYSEISAHADVYAHLKSMAADGVSRQEILDLAGGFLFRGDDVHKKVSVLSGGERARLCLAGLLLTKSNVLLLDEPTNHLDFETVEALARALRDYPGTVFFISHDRTFVNLIATQILEVKQGTVAKYPGTYEEYVDFLERQAAKEYAQPDGSKHPAGEVMPEEEATDEHPPAKQADRRRDPGRLEEKPEPETPEIIERQRLLKNEMRKIQARIRRVEIKLNHFKRERQKLLNEKAQNPFFFSRDRSEKLRDATTRLEDVQVQQKELQDKFDCLRQQKQ